MAKNLKQLDWLSVSVLIICTTCTGQQNVADTVNAISSNRQGVELLRKSLITLGDISSNAPGQYSISVANEQYIHLGQSLVPLPPFERYCWKRHFFFDPANRYSKSWSRQEYSGFVFENVHVTNKGAGFDLNIDMKTYLKADTVSPLITLDLLPQTYLRAVLQSPLFIEYVDKEIIGDNAYHVIQGKTSSAVQFWIEETSFHVFRIEHLATSSAYGVTSREYQFNDYFDSHEIKFPGTVKYTLFTEVMEPVINVFTVKDDRADGQSIPSDVLLRGYSEPGANNPSEPEIKKLASGIYLYQNITGIRAGHSYNVLFAEFETFVLVMEAPVSTRTSEVVMKTISESIPGKPIKYLVQSHHHNDHLAGLRSYIASEVTVVTTESNEALINRLAQAPFHHNPDMLDLEPKAPSFEFVRNKKWIKEDAAMTVEVYDIGPTLHANEMLVAYFPKEGILFQSDMIIFGEHPHNTPLNRQFSDWIKKQGIVVNQIAGVHGQTLNRKLVDEFLNEDWE